MLKTSVVLVFRFLPPLWSDEANTSTWKEYLVKSDKEPDQEHLFTLKWAINLGIPPDCIRSTVPDGLDLVLIQPYKGESYISFRQWKQTAFFGAENPVVTPLHQANYHVVIGSKISGLSLLGCTVVLLMEEILHHLICSLSHYLQGFIHPRWCRISSINSMYTYIYHCEKMIILSNNRSCKQIEKTNMYDDEHHIQMHVYTV